MNLANPLIEVKNNEFMILLTDTYEPQNLNFNFSCENIGAKGVKNKLILSIKMTRNTQLKMFQ